MSLGLLLFVRITIYRASLCGVGSLSDVKRVSGAAESVEETTQHPRLSITQE